LDVKSLLPVFHFHETTRDVLEPAFQYLAENRYHSVGADDMAAVVYGRKPVPTRAVVLAFDDALASLWLVAWPLLRQYGLRAIAYAIPGRVREAETPRPTIEDGPVDAVAADTAENPLATWAELKEMSASGWIDVQSHTWSHSMIFSASSPRDVLRPDQPAEMFFNLPRLNVDDPPVFLGADRFGHPMFPRRSRMSDALRFLPDADGVAAVEHFVQEQGGRAFFARAGWRRELGRVLRGLKGRTETDAERRSAIEHELIAARDTLESRLGTKVRHMCLPWGVSGRITTDLLSKLGFETAVANRWSGMYALRKGDHPFFLKRLPHRHIRALPGHGRRAMRTFT
jgi:peptidoglycan/xylan/chitin deacetylase (PgdA/CDA1 family)